MKSRLLMASAIVALTCGTAYAGKTADQVRIYINPGHGSWTGNDRPCQTIGRQPYNIENVDTTGFFESNTNLHKGFALLDKLVEAGVPFDRTKNQTNSNPDRIGAALDMSQHIVMSHVKVGPYPAHKGDDNGAYNRPLSEIREEVEANNFDVFISIHSNAAGEGSPSNYPLFIFRGKDDETYSAPGSKAMAQHIWPYAFSNEHQMWSYYSKDNANVRGDLDFYGSGSETSNNGTNYMGYLGVLKHGVPGFLVEGYFHTYQPARQRAMNDDVCRHEGHLYARGLIDYMGWKAEKTGTIYGIVRDLHEKFSQALYKPAARTNDVYMPLNGVTVKLFKAGVEVATYTTDNEWNGAFIFDNLEPGEYTLTYTAKGYKGATEEYLKPVTVEANGTAYINTYLESESYVPPTVVYENYPDEIGDNKAYGVADKYNVAAEGEETSPLATQLEGKTVRRQIIRNGHLFVLALDAANEPFIYDVNLADNSVAEISTEGTTLEENRQLKISDIAFTADNILVATSYGENQFSNDQIASGDVRGSVAIYKWTKNDNELPTGAPALWFTSQNSGNYYNALTGRTIAASGTSEEGSIVVTAQTKGSSTSMRFIEFGISGGALATTTFINKNVSADSNYTGNKLGDDYQLVVSPLSENQYVIDGSNTNPVEWQTAGNNTDAPLMGTIPADVMAPGENGASFFKFAGNDLMVAPVVAEGKVAGLKLVNVTNGFDNAKLLTTTGAAVTPAEAAYTTATGEVVTERNADDVITDAYFNLYLVRDGKVSKFTTKNVEQPTVSYEYAYNLAANVGETETTFTFDATGAAPAANIVLMNKDTKEVLATVPAGDVKEGANSAVIANEQLPEGELAWGIEIANQNAARPNMIASVPGFAKARGLVIDNTPTSQFFGNIYVANCTANDKYAKGVYILDHKLNVSEKAYGADGYTASHTASPYRLGINENGVVFISDWNDPTSGIRLLDPANLNANTTEALPNLFQFTKRDNDGRLFNGDVLLGSSTTAAAIYGTGENTKLYTFDEDYNADGATGNVVLRYDLGAALTWDKAPSAMLGHNMMDNTNVEIVPDEGGLWVAQSRGAGNNASNCPSFVYIDNDGNQLFNSGSIADYLNGTNGSALAISKDRKTLVVVDADSNLAVFSVTWNDKTPSLKYEYTVKTGGTITNQIQYDYAGNLYVLNQKCLQVWALPTDNNNVTTPAEGTITIAHDGVENVAAAATRVYPNPATDVVNVEAAEAIESIAVFNISGAMVNASSNVNGNNATINVSELASGIYFVRINNGAAVRIIKK